MKTIFITSFHPLISRNILSTPTIDLLLQRGDTQIVVVIPDNKRKFFNEKIGRPGVIIEAIPRTNTSYDGFFRYLALAVLNTRSLAIKRKTELEGQGAFIARFIGGRPFWLAVIRTLERILYPRNFARELFLKYRPELVFATDVQNEEDVRLMRAASRRGVATIGMVRSWDNLTSKGLVRFIPDKLLVNNEIVKNEAIHYHYVPKEKIEVVGIPHYDFYINGERSSRDEFFKQIGGDPRKRLILFAPTGDRYLAANTVDRDVLEILRDSIPSDCQILVRFPPQDTVDFAGFENNGRVFFDRQTSTYTANPRKVEFTPEMEKHLADTLFYADVLVVGPSTMSVDAALFDKPIISIGFDGKEKREYYNSIRRYFDYNHQQAILKSGGVKYVTSALELQEALSLYLLNPQADAEGRKRIVREQCWRDDGKSSERVTDAILSSMSA